MAQQIIDVGDAIDDGTGDPARVSFTKCNDNFTELYARGSLTPPQGRLTLATATPVMTTTQSAKTTIFYTPYVGNMVPLYDGNTFTMHVIAAAFGEISAVTTDTTKSPAAIGANKVNDWFVWLDGTTVRLGHGPDWTNDTTRSGGTTLVNNGGILVNGNAITNGPSAQRGTYVGTTRSNASSQLDFIFATVAANGGAGFIGVWNAYNRVNIKMQMNDSTGNWTYGSAAWRAANNSATARISFVSGLQEDGWSARHNGIALNSATGYAYRGVGYDSTIVLSGYPGTNQILSANTFAEGVYSTTSLGFHFVSAIEYMGGGTGTFYGSTANLIYSWLDFDWWC